MELAEFHRGWRSFIEHSHFFSRPHFDSIESPSTAVSTRSLRRALHCVYPCRTAAAFFTSRYNHLKCLPRHILSYHAPRSIYSVIAYRHHPPAGHVLSSKLFYLVLTVRHSLFIILLLCNHTFWYYAIVINSPSFLSIALPRYHTYTY